jgi:hypothetical protein
VKIDRLDIEDKGIFLGEPTECYRLGAESKREVLNLEVVSRPCFAERIDSRSTPIATEAAVFYASLEALGVLP